MRTALAPLIVVVVSVAGCGGAASPPATTILSQVGSEASQSAPDPGPTVSVTAAVSATGPDLAPLPMSQYDLRFAVSYTPEQLGLVQAAFQKLYTDCMNAQGYRESPFPPLPDAVQAARRAWRNLRFDDVVSIGEQGYHMLNPVPVSAAPTANTEVDVPGQGDASDRCKTKANAKVGQGKPVGSAADSIVQAQLDLLLSMQTDSSLDSFREAWHRCMKNAGFGDLQITDSRWQRDFASQPSPTPDEIRTALADSHCRTSSGYTDAKLRWLASHVEAWLTDHEGAIVAIRGAIDAEVAAAKLIVG